jgi:hypothetical protein
MGRIASPPPVNLDEIPELEDPAPVRNRARSRSPSRRNLSLIKPEFEDGVYKVEEYEPFNFDDNCTNSIN